MNWNSRLPLIDRLRATEVQTIYHEQTVGFLGSDESIEHRKVAANPDGEEAAKMIENLQAKIDRMSIYVQHDAGCSANDLDYLDKAPCTCGLRGIVNPKGLRP